MYNNFLVLSNFTHSQGYNVYNATSNTLVMTATEDQVKIGGLQPYTAYSFQVQPYSKGNRGKKSDPLGITTDVGG